jgi:hypothetical protein
VDVDALLLRLPHGHVEGLPFHEVLAEQLLGPILGGGALLVGVERGRRRHVVAQALRHKRLHASAELLREGLLLGGTLLQQVIDEEWMFTLAQPRSRGFRRSGRRQRAATATTAATAAAASRGIIAGHLRRQRRGKILRCRRRRCCRLRCALLARICLRLHLRVSHRAERAHRPPEHARDNATRRLIAWQQLRLLLLLLQVGRGQRQRLPAAAANTAAAAEHVVVVVVVHGCADFCVCSESCTACRACEVDRGARA